MTDSKQLPGKFVWHELVTTDPERAQAFYGEVLGWKTAPFPMGPDSTYPMIAVGETMIGGYGEAKRLGERSHWVACASIVDVDAAVVAAKANGGRAIEEPYQVAKVGRLARIADPDGAELFLIHGDDPDAPDRDAREGEFLWNELHAPDPVKALAFYKTVLGYDSRGMEGPEGTYHILSQGGVDRGGATHHGSEGVPPHWLPYVHVADPDATLARAARQGGSIAWNAMEIPGIGRFGVLTDPTGANLAVMRPAPMMKKG